MRRPLQVISHLGIYTSSHVVLCCGRFWYGMEAVYKVWVEGEQLEQEARQDQLPVLHFTSVHKWSRGILLTVRVLLLLTFHKRIVSLAFNM